MNRQWNIRHTISMPFIGNLRLPPPTTTTTTQTHISTLCVRLPVLCAHTHTGISRWWQGGGGIRGFAPAPPSSAHWLSGPSEESDNTLMTGHHLPQQQQGEAMHQLKKKKKKTLPPLLLLLLLLLLLPPPLSPLLFSPGIGLCFPEIMWFNSPIQHPHLHPLHTHLLFSTPVRSRPCVFFSCC